MRTASLTCVFSGSKGRNVRNGSANRKCRPGRRHFQYDLLSGENHFPQNVYPQDIPALRAQLRPLRKYPLEVRNGDIWVNLE